MAAEESQSTLQVHIRLLERGFEWDGCRDVRTACLHAVRSACQLSFVLGLQGGLTSGREGWQVESGRQQSSYVPPPSWHMLSVVLLHMCGIAAGFLGLRRAGTHGLKRHVAVYPACATFAFRLMSLTACGFAMAAGNEWQLAPRVSASGGMVVCFLHVGLRCIRGFLLP
jgi:hypothetical protein